MTDKPSHPDSLASGEHSHPLSSTSPSEAHGTRIIEYVVPGTAPEFVGPTEAEKLALRSFKGPCLTEMLGTWPGDVDDGFEDWIQARRRAARLKQWFPF